MGNLKKYVFGRVKGGVLDADAQAFLTATGINNPTIINALNEFVVNSKLSGIYQKMQIIYPNIGGTSFTHKFNLKNITDSDSAFRQVFTNNQHSANGVYYNLNSLFPSNSRTFFTPNTNLIDKDNFSIGAYNRLTANGVEAALFGGFNESIGQGIIMYPFRPDQSKIRVFAGGNANLNGGITTNAQGLSSITKINNADDYIYKNGALNFTRNGSNGITSNYEINLGVVKGNGLFHTLQCEISFFYVGSALTSAEELTWYNLIQTFETALGRQV